MSHHINLTRIKGVANALSDLKDEIAFVGGATVSLYADTPEYIEVRPSVFSLLPISLPVNWKLFMEEERVTGEPVKILRTLYSFWTTGKVFGQTSRNMKEKCFNIFRNSSATY